jgi:ABC-2 type transport system ATP-binding protein
MPTALLDANHLTKDYGSFRALDSFSLKIAPGEIFGLLGPNGSGKSTAIRLLMGFMKPTSGTCSIGGFDSWTQGVQARRLLGYLPGELRLYENMTGRRLITFLGRMRGETFGKELDDFALSLDINIDQPLINMSSGMKRKIALMSVLIPRTPLIILDEPTNTLDPTMRDTLLDQLLRAKHRGQTILFSSHVLAEVERVCDRVGILQRGKLVHLQEMASLQEGRTVQARFRNPPSLDPLGKPITPSMFNGRGDVCLEYHGELQVLLNWLRLNDATEVRIEPAGLGPIYHRFHGVTE